MAATPGFASTPKDYGVLISTSDPSRQSPSASGLLVTGTSAGVAIPAFFIKATASVTAGGVIFFMHNGTNFFPLHEEPVAVTSPTSSGTSSFEAVWAPETPVFVTFGWTLRVSTLQADTFAVTAPGAGEL